MRNKLNHVIILCVVFLSFVLFSGCEYDKPTEIYPIEGTANPTINSIAPDSAFNGIIEIKIAGDNFSQDTGQNFVYFGQVEGEVISASKNELTVRRPLTTSGALIVKVVVRDAFQPTEFGPYKLEAGITQLGELGQVTSIAMDKEENLYADWDNVIYKITLDGEVSEYGTFEFKSSAMRMAPDGYLFIHKRDNRDLYRLAPGGGVAEKYLRIRKKVSCFDFDQEGFIYSGGVKYGLYVTNPDSNISTEIVGYKQKYMITAVRVFDGYLYVAADTLIDLKPVPSLTTIYKHELKGNGEVGEKIKFFDWTSAPDYSELLINDITFAENGEMYIATDHANPVLIVHPDGSIEQFLAGTLQSTARQLCWGNGKYLYINQFGEEDEDSNIKRIVMGKQGAPYYGRQ